MPKKNIEEKAITAFTNDTPYHTEDMYTYAGEIDEDQATAVQNDTIYTYAGSVKEVEAEQPTFSSNVRAQEMKKRNR